MRKLLVVYCLFILLVSPVIANWSTSDYLEIELNISSKIKLVPTDRSYSISKVLAMVNLYPLADYRQHVLYSATEPNSNEFEKTLVFTWDKPKKLVLPFSLSSKIITESKPLLINGIVKYPLQDLPATIQRYLRETKLIDYSNESIKTAAKELIKNETDLYKIVYIFAEWTKRDVNYSIETITADASQKASWVLINQIGVCDEITNLFIAMLRSQGIPAKFVSGLSYTGTEDNVGQFVPHGWAEVYFPQYGWLPVDVTYNQIGYLDATHIKLRDGLDSEETSTKYEWVGNNVNIVPTQLNFSVNVKQQGQQVSPKYEIQVFPEYKHVNIGSFNRINVVVTNPNEYYLPLELSLTNSKGILFYGDSSKSMLLEPYETKEVSFMVQVDSSLAKQYSYSFNIGVYDKFNVSAQITFSARYGSAKYNEQLEPDFGDMSLFEKIIAWVVLKLQ